MSTLAIVLIVLGVAVVALFVGGFLARRRHDRRYAGTYARNLEEADRALETARAEARTRKIKNIRQALEPLVPVC